jgi:hypothetical protein
MLFKYLPIFIGREFGEIDEYIFKRYGYAGMHELGIAEGGQLVVIV